ncbi:MAG: hypothetical protein ILA52_03280 [Alphaproteobacteria bacterium]|nr:hypothetical protein [Alphaproteobacteria bacterium]
MSETPIIVISSSVPQVGKTTLALNLAAALWNDNYHVYLFAPDNPEVHNFIKMRKQFCQEHQIDLPMPTLLPDIKEPDKFPAKSVIIADIPTSGASAYADIFAKAHTLISVGTNISHLQWEFKHPYMELIWNAKKSIASRGIKYLNWIAVMNMSQTNDTASSKLTEMSRRFGYRVASPLQYREAFCHISEGYCAADMLHSPVFAMSLNDVYARREILTLTDFLWQHK